MPFLVRSLTEWGRPGCLLLGDGVGAESPALYFSGGCRKGLLGGKVCSGLTFQRSPLA